MKKTYSLLFFLLVSYFSFAQPVCNNAGNYEIGEVFQFQNCDATNLWDGTNGINQTWNFSNLLPIPADTITLRIVHTSSTPFDSLYAGTAMVEYYSDGRYYFFNKTATDNYYTGMVDVNNNITMFYDNTNRIAHRPLNQITNITDNYNEHFTYQTYNLVGSGTTTITGMGYGTLILPNDTFYNVLKVKTTQIQVDTIIQFSNIATNTFVTWAWYDTVHKAPLFRIDSLDNPVSTDKYASYYLSEWTVGVNDVVQGQNDFSIYPNPASHNLTLHPLKPGIISIINPLGQTVFQEKIDEGVISKTINIECLNKGIYFLKLTTESEQYSQKLLVE